MDKKILSVVGARPQFVKAAMVSAEIDRTDGVGEVLVHTGQHFDANMSHLFFEEMGLRAPDHNLGIHSLPHEALSAHRKGVRLCHVEAGLRSFNPQMREEYNRVQTDRLADVLFCPTQTAIDNLLQEGIDAAKIVPTGDVMKDAALHFAALARAPQEALPDPFVLCTLHRAENTDDPDILKQLLYALEQTCGIVSVVMPLHPRTRLRLQEMEYPIEQSPICFIDPVGYLEMLYLQNHCKLILTDSGGVQKEAYFAKKYCITLREETEWVELLHRGYNHLVGHDPVNIVTTVQNLLDMPPLFNDDLYGDGHTARTIVQRLLA